MIKMFSSKKPAHASTNRRNGNLVSNTQINSRVDLSCSEASNGLIFLFIPYIIFTDVDEVARSEVIQGLVIDSWEKVSTRLFSQPIVADNPDTFHGTLYLSLGLTMGILIYGKSFDIRKMKSEAVECARQLS